MVPEAKSEKGYGKALCDHVHGGKQHISSSCGKWGKKGHLGPDWEGALS